MTTRKRNDFLDIGSSDDEGSDRGYDSEELHETKGSKVRAVKRRRLSEDELKEGSEDEDREIQQRQQRQDEEEDENEPEREENEDNTGNTPTTTPSKSKPASSLTKTRKNKTGVIYLSSLPPYLKPSALKSMLVARGFEPINRIFLTPYVPPASRHTGAAPAKRNRRRMYTDGWVEFKSKRTAKVCADTLNATIVGGKKGGWYHDDIWNMKYLRGFKWDDLMEQVQRERREAEARRRIEDAKAKKEEKVFIAGVERGKVVEGMRKKREEKERKRERPEAAGDGDVLETKQLRKVERVFRQNEVKEKSKRQDGAIDPEVRRVLGKIF